MTTGSTLEEIEDELEDLDSDLRDRFGLNANLAFNLRQAIWISDYFKMYTRRSECPLRKMEGVCE